MTTRRSATARSRAQRPWTLCAALLVLCLAAVACGDDSATLGSAPTPGGEADSGGQGDGESTIGGESDDAPSGSERPDWAPVWLLLPEGLEITLSFQDPSTGEANLTGFVIDADPDKLLSDATFMVQSGGYILGDEFESEAGMGFNATHTGDQGIVRFGVVSIDERTTQWSMEFSAGGADPVGDDGASGPSATDPGAGFDGEGVLTMMVADRTLVADGECIIDGTFGQFLSDDGLSRMSLEDSGERSVEGAVTVTVDGKVESWLLDPSVGAPRYGISSVGMRYEGGIESVDGAASEVGTVDINCS